MPCNMTGAGGGGKTTGVPKRVLVVWKAGKLWKPKNFWNWKDGKVQYFFLIFDGGMW